MTLSTRISSVTLALIFFAARSALAAASGFDGIQCGSDVQMSLLGRTMPNERVQALEEKHKDLELKDLGAYEVSEKLSLISWRICGKEYDLLEEGSTVRDVLPSPAHSRAAPKFIGACTIDGADKPGTIVAVLNGDTTAKTLSATAAWKVDESQKKFVSLPTGGVLCPRDGIVTEDGGP